MKISFQMECAPKTTFGGAHGATLCRTFPAIAPDDTQMVEAVFGIYRGVELFPGCCTGEAICTNRATILREVVEDRVLIGLRSSLMHAKPIATFVEEHRRAFSAEPAGANADRVKARHDVTQIDKKIAGKMAAIKDGMYQLAIKGRMAELDAEKQRPGALFEESPEPLRGTNDKARSDCGP